MRLRTIERVDFRMNEQTNFEQFSKKNRTLVKTLGKDDVVLFINHGENQLVFVHGFDEIPGRGAESKLRILASRRLRMTGGTWNPLRLANYAKDVGLELDGLKRFEEYYANLDA